MQATHDTPFLRKHRRNVRRQFRQLGESLLTDIAMGVPAAIDRRGGVRALLPA